MEKVKMDSKTVHKEDRHQRKRVTCEKCDKTFAENYYLKKHVESIHEGKKVQCHECNKE